MSTKHTCHKLGCASGQMLGGGRNVRGGAQCEAFRSLETFNGIYTKRTKRGGGREKERNGENVIEQITFNSKENVLCDLSNIVKF